MKYQLYGVQDVKVAAFITPLLFMRSQAEAERVFRDICSDPNSQLHKHPDDFKLFGLGSFDDGTGLIEPLRDGPLYVMSGSDAVTIGG